jgi:quercetin dioxygenase-like cupin family protein/DNA-binding XRE family transcriptional regulator
MKEVAGAAGVSASLVSQIERNRISPAMDTLLALADVLDLDLEYLFAEYRRDRSVHVVRRLERTAFSRPGVLYERLAQLEVQGRDGIEAYCISIKPKASTQGKEYGHPGWELGLVEEGRAELTVGTKTYKLEAGDSVSFRSDSPHVLANTGPGTLRVFWIITPPKGEIGT